MAADGARVRARRRPWAGAWIGALLLAAPSCGDVAPVAPRDGPSDEARAAIGPLVATLQLPATAVDPGGHFVVRYRLANLSSDSVRVEFACATDVMIGVRDADGGWVRSGGCLTTISRRTLAPGGFLLHDLAWRAERPGAGPTPLPAGRYEVVAEPTILRIDDVAVAPTPVRLTRSLQVR
jgi:hypothetical protein